MTSVYSSDSWKRIATDPDPVRDLGYDLAEWESHRVTYRDGDRFVFVPVDEDAFDREAYIVATEDAMCDTLERR
ncbi:hypothetical protein [Halobellus captivus]|uniref:hypothetical protein n=1 Tax=Halobellus captivus TaxID=2592614 RepID=UPI0011A80BB7|nr:hypothetical protein [Halobellus captivus]